MKLDVLGSSSSGNCYVISNQTEALILEAGVAFREVKKILGYNLRKVVGCLCTHAHNDHAKHIDKMVVCGIRTLALPDVWTAKGVSMGRYGVAIEPYKGYKLGNFKVMPFNAMHDVPCVGYHIEHPEIGRLLFLTDSCDCPHIFPGLNHIMIECNYSMPRLIEAINEGVTRKAQLDRLPNSHMEFGTTKSVLAEHDLSEVQDIMLLHLSEHNSVSAQFEEDIERLTGRMVYIARPGLSVDITKI